MNKAQRVAWKKHLRRKKILEVRRKSEKGRPG